MGKYVLPEREIAEAIRNVASALHLLGTANAATDMGAIEVLAMKIDAGAALIAEALDGLADAVREHGAGPPTAGG